jgi:hypothetical protein
MHEHIEIDRSTRHRPARLAYLSAVLVACAGAAPEREAPRVESTSLSGSLELRRRADLPLPTECWNESDCPSPRHCIGFDRNGEDTFRADETVPFREWRRLCVSACTNDQDCPPGFACLGHAEYIVLATEREEGRVETYRTCAPHDPYGTATRGEPCGADDECAPDAPYCVDRRCERSCSRCPPDCPRCPEGETCEDVFRLTAGSTETLPICVPPPRDHDRGNPFG